MCQVFKIEKGQTNDLWSVRYKAIDESWKEEMIVPQRDKIFIKKVTCVFVFEYNTSKPNERRCRILLEKKEHIPPPPPPVTVFFF